MPETQWANALDKIENHLVRIETPTGGGTGFFIAVSRENDAMAIATALHVVDYAHKWQQPIKLIHYKSGGAIVLKEEDRLIYPNQNYDLALIRVPKQVLSLPDSPIPLAGKRHLREGVELGWCGFPSVHPSKLCFFSGCVSAWLEDMSAYLVDGVVINGVSGGPAFISPAEGNMAIVGLVTAYIPNRATGEALPGVGLIRSVLPYNDFFEQQKRVPAQADTRAKEDDTHD